MTKSLKKKQLIVGVTGNIGSGKSTVCNELIRRGFPVYDSDSRAKWLIRHDSEIKKQIILSFGQEAYLTNGSYNSSYIASQVFSDPVKLIALNRIIHPAVGYDFNVWRKAQIASIVFKESALIFEAKLEKLHDLILLVYAPKEIRCKRVMERDGLTEDAVLNRMKNQIPDEEKISKSDYVIYNDGFKDLDDEIEKFILWLAEKK